MNPWLFLLVWGCLGALQSIFGIVAAWQRADRQGHKRLWSLVLSGLASFVPWTTFLLFIWVFVIGRSSNVAQMAGESGFDLWSLWFHAWPWLYFSNPPAFLIILLAALLPPYPPGHWKSFTSRAAAVANAACSWFVVVTLFPDA